MRAWRCELLAAVTVYQSNKTFSEMSRVFSSAEYRVSVTPVQIEGPVIFRENRISHEKWNNKMVIKANVRSSEMTQGMIDPQARIPLKFSHFSCLSSLVSVSLDLKTYFCCLSYFFSEMIRKGQCIGFAWTGCGGRAGLQGGLLWEAAGSFPMCDRASVSGLQDGSSTGQGWAQWWQ